MEPPRSKRPLPASLKNGCKHCSTGWASQEVPARPPNSHLHKRKYPSLTEKDRTSNYNEEQKGRGQLQGLRRRGAQLRQEKPKRAGDGKCRSGGAPEAVADLRIAEAEPPPVPCGTLPPQPRLPPPLPPHRSLLAEGASRRESGGPVKTGVRGRSGASQDPSGRGGGGRGGRSRGGAEDSRVLPSTSEHTRGAKPGQSRTTGAEAGRAVGAEQRGRPGGRQRRRPR